MKKVTKFILIFVILIVLAVSLFGGYMVFSYYDNPVDIVEKDNKIHENIDKSKDTILVDTKVEQEEKDKPIYKTEKREESVINIVLLGMDAREHDTRSRSDSIIFLSYNTEGHIVKLISFMRDTWVYLPEKGWSRINSATAYGGVGLLINTLNENFDLDIQEYVVIKFEDFKKVIDIMGGIDIELTKSEIRYINNKSHIEDKDYNNDLEVKDGVVHLNGAQTLWHCRNRSIGNSDFSRTERQREVLKILMDKVLDMSYSDVFVLLFDLKDYVSTNVSLNTILNLLSEALSYKNIEIEMYRLPFDDMFKFANKNGASVIEIDLEKTTKKLHEILDF